MRKLNVLMVDDNPQFLKAARDLIAAQPCVAGVECVSSAFEALTRLGLCKPDLVLTDIMMPDMSVFVLMRKLREGDAPPRVIAVTLHEGPEYRAAVRRSDPAWRMPLCCVNLTAASLCEPEFARYVQDEVQRSKFPARNLCFEIAEPDLIDHHAGVQAFMGVLRPLGFRFTLEAFARTQMSFAPLKGLPFDFLKIDGSW